MELSNTINRVIFGPKLEGTVRQVLADPVVEGVQHILIETANEGHRHIMTHDRALAISREGIGVTDEIFSPGEEIHLNIRGNGMWLLPWSKIDRNPFGLEK